MENLENNVTGELHAPNVHENYNLTPRIGQEFDSLSDVHDFYKAFAKEEGFGVRIRTTKENFCMYVCSNAGQYVANNSGNEESSDMMGKIRKRCSSSRTDCKASVVVSKAKNGLK